jgi:hypothetical protein
MEAKEKRKRMNIRKRKGSLRRRCHTQVSWKTMFMLKVWIFEVKSGDSLYVGSERNIVRLCRDHSLN